jgi:hypothetical protein
MMGEAQHIGMLEVPPRECPVVRPTAHPPRNRHAVPPEGAHGRGGRRRPRDGVTQEPHGVLDLPVGIADAASILRVAEANRYVKR